MLKRNAIVKFVFLAIIAILGILLCVCPFSVPYSANNYNGFIPAINKGFDLKGGVSALYECNVAEGNNENLSKAIDNSLENLENMFEYERFSELYVSRQGGNKINISASDALDINKAFTYIEDAKSIYFTVTQASDSVNSPEIYLTSSDIYKVYPNYDYENESYGITIEFNAQGDKNLQTIKDYANKTSNKTVYVYLGSINADNLFTQISASDIKSDSIFLTSSSNSYSISSGEDARKIAYSIAGGTLQVELKLIEISNVSAFLGTNTLLYISICLIITIIASFAFLWLRYGDLGLLGSFALVFYSILTAFFMQAIPFITLNLSGVFGLIVGYFVALLANVVIFEKIREEYAIGKKIHLSCKGGFKKALWPILDSHFILILIGLCIWIFAPTMLKCFGIALIVSSILSIFTSLVITRSFVSNYLLINSTKAKKLHLYRDKQVKEIRDEDVSIISEELVPNSAEGGNNE